MDYFTINTNTIPDGAKLTIILKRKFISQRYSINKPSIKK